MEELIVITTVFAFFVQSASLAVMMRKIKMLKKEKEAVEIKDGDEKISRLSGQTKEKEIVDNILKGIENNEFKMYLQFIVDNKTEKIVSAEALSRWDCPQKGIIGPVNYIENMELTGTISKHDFYMFDMACRQLEKWSNT